MEGNFDYKKYKYLPEIKIENLPCVDFSVFAMYLILLDPVKPASLVVFPLL